MMIQLAIGPAPFCVRLLVFTKDIPSRQMPRIHQIA